MAKSQWAFTSAYTRSEITAWSHAYWTMPAWSVSSSIRAFPICIIVAVVVMIKQLVSCN